MKKTLAILLLNATLAQASALPSWYLRLTALFGDRDSADSYILDHRPDLYRQLNPLPTPPPVPRGDAQHQNRRAD